MHALTRPGVTEENLTSFIGNNAEKIIRRGSRDISWCWPALFFSYLWLAYRKAYLAAFVMMIVDFSAEILDYLSYTAAPNSALSHFHFSVLIVHVLLALFGLRYYLNFASKKVAVINREVMDSALRQTFYKAKGGTSGASVIGFIFLCLISNTFSWYIQGGPEKMHDVAIHSYSTQTETTQTTKVTVQNGQTTINSTIVQNKKTSS